jgi:putative methyltransferase
MKNKGKIFAFERDEKRARQLKDNTDKAGTKNVEVATMDFLHVDPNDPKYAEVKAILLDPSCSGSGTYFYNVLFLINILNFSIGMQTIHQRVD